MRRLRLKHSPSFPCCGCYGVAARSIIFTVIPRGAFLLPFPSTAFPPTHPLPPFTAPHHRRSACRHAPPPDRRLPQRPPVLSVPIQQSLPLLRWPPPSAACPTRPNSPPVSDRLLLQRPTPPTSRALPHTPLFPTACSLLCQPNPLRFRFRPAPRGGRRIYYLIRIYKLVQIESPIKVA